MQLNPRDIEHTLARYNERYQQFGYSPQALGWWGGKQSLRFDILTSQYDCTAKFILDVGCGFGDLNKTLSKKVRNYRYLGIDVNPNFITRAREIYTFEHIQFQVAEFFSFQLPEPCDFVVESGIFNHRYFGHDNYEVIEAAIAKALSLSRDGLAFDFNSDKRTEVPDNVFCANPSKVLSIALAHSKNVVLRHDYMPYEFTIFIYKDDRFQTADKIFERYKQLNAYTSDSK